MLAENYRLHIVGGLRKDLARRLVTDLQNNGCSDEAELLRLYLDRGDTSTIINDGIWKGHTCHIGLLPPAQANVGTMWFDVMELTPMIVVPEIDHHGGRGRHFLVAAHPIYVWQFRAFAEVVKWCYTTIEQLRRETFLGVDLSKQADMDYVCGVTNEEIFAYTMWFGKIPTELLILRSAHQSLSNVQFSQVLPDDLKLWGHTRAPAYDWRMAIGRHNLMLEPREQLNRIDEMDLPDQRRMWYNFERTRSPHISGSSCFLAEEGLARTVPPIHVHNHFVDLLNSVNRSVGQ